MRIRSVLILNSHQRTSPNGNDNHNKQASCFIFSPFEAIFASSKFYKVARIYWVVASSKLSHRVHLDLFNHVNLFTRKQYCWIHFWNRILAFIQSFQSPPKMIPDIFWFLDILLKPSWLQKGFSEQNRIFFQCKYMIRAKYVLFCLFMFYVLQYCNRNFKSVLCVKDWTWKAL